MEYCQEWEKLTCEGEKNMSPEPLLSPQRSRFSFFSHKYCIRIRVGTKKAGKTDNKKSNVKNISYVFLESVKRFKITPYLEKSEQ